MTTHLIIPDTQIKPDTDLEFLLAIGKKIVEERPDVIIHVGDHYDLPSLSTYDKGRKAEGRRLQADLQAGYKGMAALLHPIRCLQENQRYNKKKVYKPRMVFTMGNHENRLERHIDAHPELEGMYGQFSFGLEEDGWEVYPFLKPVTIDGIAYAHYFYAPMSGRPYGGTAITKLKNIGTSFTQGHQQGLDWANLPRPDGTQRMGLVAGSCYLHDEEYKGPQANNHWRGIIIKRNVDGVYDPEFISTRRLMEE